MNHWKTTTFEQKKWRGKEEEEDDYNQRKNSEEFGNKEHKRTKRAHALTTNSNT